MWKSKLKIEEGETIRLDDKYKKGNLGQEEVELYSALNFDGEVIGSVQYTDHTSIKTLFRRSLHVVQRENNGQTLVDERWSE